MVTPVPLPWQKGGTYAIPGQGRIYEQAGMVEYRDMVTVIRDMSSKGLTLEQIQAANPTQGYRARCGSDSGSWSTSRFVEAVYKSLPAK